MQAWVDGELDADQAERVGEWVANDAAAGALAAELRGVKAAMAGAELARKAPVSPEFYWSQVQRQIQAEAALARPKTSRWMARWRRFFMPVAGLAVACCVVLLSVELSAGVSRPDVVSSSNEGMDTMMFHDQSSGLTVVWLQDKSAQSDASSASDNDNSIDTD